MGSFVGFPDAEGVSGHSTREYSVRVCRRIYVISIDSGGDVGSKIKLWQLPTRS